MNCRPLRWLLGLPFLALLGAIALLGELPHIQDDLAGRANQALQAAGFNWAKVDFEARDAHVTGSAASEQEQQAVLDAVRNTWGVRSIGDETTLIEALKPYTWTIARDGRNVTIEGYAANDLDRKSLNDVAISQLHGVSVKQVLKLARGMPPREQWLAAVGFTSAQMLALSKGEAKLTDLGLAISGTAATPESYAAISKALKGQVPNGLRIVDAAIKPPLVKPYALNAEWKSPGLTLEGYVPSEEVHQRVLAAAAAAFAKAAVTDHLKIASGDPEGWVKVAEAGLKQVAKLESGGIRVSDTSAEIHGVATDQDVAEDASLSFDGAMPAGFKSKSDVTFRKARVPVIKPYSWSAALSGKTLDLSGYVPDDKTKSDIAAMVTQRFAGVRLNDHTALGRGAPDGFEQAAMAGLDQLSRLDMGAAKLTDTTLVLTGHAADPMVAAAAASMVAAALPGGFTPSVDVQSDKPKAPAPAAAKPVEPAKPVEVAKPVEPAKPVEVAKPAVTATKGPYDWDAVLDKGTLTVSGGTPGGEARDYVQSIISSRLPGVTVINNMTPVDAVPSSVDDWLRSIDAGLKAIADLGGGHVHIHDRALNVTGATSDKAMPDYITESLHQAVPQAYASSAKVDYAPPPEPPAYVTTLKYDGLRVALEGLVPDAASRDKLLARLKSLFPDRDFDDHTSVQPGAPAGWFDALVQGVAPLSTLDAGQLTLRDRSLYLSGTTEDEKLLDAARKKVTAGLPKGYGGTDQLTYVAPPAPDPKLIAKKQDESKYDISKLMKQPSLNPAECQAVLNSLLRGKLFFATGRADLDPRSAQALSAVVAATKRCPKTRVEISGHTDSDGAAAFNQRLSERRADAVVKWLALKGVPGDRMKAVGYGETQPVAPNDTPANKAKNRRIEFVVTPG